MAFYNSNQLGSILLSGSLLMPAVTAIAADEAALYEKAPKDSAFIRLINTNSERTKLSIGGKALETKGQCNAGNYIYLPAGNYRIDSPNVNWSGQLRPNKAYSLVIHQTEKQLLQEDIHTSRVNGKLSVYNLSKTSGLSIKTQSGNHLVFSDIESNAIATRPINPVKIALKVFQDNNEMTSSESNVLKRGAINTLLICDTANGMTTHWASN